MPAVDEQGEPMTAEDRYIPGVPCWVDTSQPDPAAAAGFYGDLFGWEIEEVGGPEPYFIGRIRGGDVAAIGGQQDGGAATWNTYVWVQDAGETAAKVREAGGSVLAEPADVGDWGRMAVFSDPGGAVFSVWEAKAHRGATIVNEHGSVNFNDLHTRDVDGARAFYGAVFGWDTIDLGGNLAWALREYGDFLERRNPGNRERMAAAGAPARFDEVVASLIAIPTDQPDTPNHWSLTFAVDDADAVAARAAELGGRVVAEPFDAPWVRMAVIADPAGATFTASKFVPENKDVQA
jgi:uncharacterized protein